MAATVNLRIDQGTTFSTDVTVWANTGDAFDLTGYTASAKMAQGYASTRTRTRLRFKTHAGRPLRTEAPDGTMNSYE